MDKILELVIRDLCRGDKAVAIAARYNINRRTVYKMKVLHESTGGFSKRRRGGWPRYALTDENLAKIKEATTSSPTKSIPKLSKKLNLARTTISRGIKELGGKSLAIINRPLLTDRQKEHQLERAKVLLKKLRRGKEGIILFSDEKTFTVDQYNNRRNSRYIDFGETPDRIKYCPKTKNLTSVMVLGIVSLDGKVCSPIFIPKGTTVNTDVYLDLLKQHVVPWIQANYQPGEFIFQQDSAPPHASNRTQEFLKQTVRFWDKSIWPPSLPDLNLMDYYWWGVVEPISNASAHPNLDSLRAAITEAWGQINTEDIRKAVRRFRPRLEAVIEAEGGHIE